MHSWCYLRPGKSVWNVCASRFLPNFTWLGAACSWIIRNDLNLPLLKELKSVNMGRKEEFLTILHYKCWYFGFGIFCLHMLCSQRGQLSLSSYAPFSSYPPLFGPQYQERPSNATSKTQLLHLFQTAHAPQPGVMERANMLLPSPFMETQHFLIWWLPLKLDGSSILWFSGGETILAGSDT